MATSYLTATPVSAAAAGVGGGGGGEANNNNEDHRSSSGSEDSSSASARIHHLAQQHGGGGGGEEAEGGGGGAGMNLVNGSGSVAAATSAAAAAAAAGYAPAAISPGLASRGASALESAMHETKYLPPQPPPHQLHNGHPALAPHANPWMAALPGAEAVSSAHWAMHPAAASLYPQDLKQDIKPHSPADFQRHAAPHMGPHGWNPPVPVSSPYLGMSAAVTAGGSNNTSNTSSGGSSTAAATGGAGGSGAGGAGGAHVHHPPGSPSPLQHHPAYHGMGGMIPHHPAFGPPGGPGGLAGGPGGVGVGVGVGGVPPPGVGVDRYHHRDSHNSSPRSGTDEDGMQTPTSGTSSTTSSFFPDPAGTQNKYEKKEVFPFFLFVCEKLCSISRSVRSPCLSFTLAALVRNNTFSTYQGPASPAIFQ